MKIGGSFQNSEQASWNNIIVFQSGENHVFILVKVRIFIDLKSHNKEMSQTRSKGTPVHPGQQQKAEKKPKF